MAVYSGNRPNRTLTLHKEGCKRVTRAGVKPCGCGETGQSGNQRWWCEDHVDLDAVSTFMGGRFWAVLLCDECFSGR